MTARLIDCLFLISVCERNEKLQVISSSEQEKSETSRRRESNSRHTVYKTATLPLSYSGIVYSIPGSPNTVKTTLTTVVSRLYQKELKMANKGENGRISNKRIIGAY